MKILLSILCVLTVGVCQQRDTFNFLRYDKDLISPAEYKSRRDSVLKMIGNDAAAIFYAAPERMRNGDVEYRYRQGDNFFYLTGFTEPQSILILSPKGIRIKTDDSTYSTVQEVLFVQDKNPSAEIWTGRRFGPRGAEQLLGFEASLPNDKFRSTFSTLMFSGIKYLYVQPVTSDISGEIRELMSPVLRWIDNAKVRNSKVEMRDPNAMVHTMRIIKSEAEIALVRKATEISATAHNQAMMSVEPGMYEYELQALYEYVFLRQGAEYYGYPCINGSGENSVILHYNTNRKKIASGDIVLSDCGAEYRGYSSDVTRSYPASGTFSKAQKEIYTVVLNAHHAAIAAIKPGTRWSEVSQTADSVIAQGLHALGIIKEKEGREFRKFYNHGLGHPIGLNVHDVGQPMLEAGMIYTVEPGIYIPEGSEGVDPKYYNIGVRIEDVILITATGNENLSAGCPKEIKEIELLMKKKGIGNQPLK